MFGVIFHHVVFDGLNFNLEFFHPVTDNLYTIGIANKLELSFRSY
jgi:hypothetical protein